MSVLAVLGFLAVFAGGLQSQDLSGAATDTVAQSLKFEIEPVGERYCKGGPDGGVLQIDSLFRYTNMGKEPLIFYRGSGAIYKHRAAKSIEDLNSRQFEYEFRVQVVYVEDTSLRDLLHPDPKDFVILSAGESFKTKGLIPVTYKPVGSKSRGAVPPGSYLVQVDVETWPEAMDLGILLAKRWKKWGNLWYKALTTSEPLRVTVAENPKEEECR